MGIELLPLTRDDIMRMRKPYIATLDRVQIRRDGEYAIIGYVEDNRLIAGFIFAEMLR